MVKEKDAAPKALLLGERLAQYPELQARVAEMLALVENERGNVNTADEAEEHAFEQVRRLGQELMQHWAERKHERVVSEYDSRPDHRRKGKKKPAG